VSNEKPLSNAEKEEIYRKALSIQDTDDIDLIRSVSCAFFREGGCKKVYSSQCKGCLDESSVLICRSEYLLHIFDRPAHKWTPEFDKPTKSAKKVKIEELGSSVGVQCSSCYMADRCPLFSAGSECSIDWGQGVNVSDLGNKDIVNHLMQIQYERVTRMSTFERVDGGMADMNLSSEMDRLSRLAADRYDLEATRIKASFEARGVGASSEGGGGGVLAKLFGGGANREIEHKEQKGLPDAHRPTQLPETTEEIEYIEAKDTTENAKKKKRTRKT